MLLAGPELSCIWASPWFTDVRELSNDCKEGSRQAVENGRNLDSFSQRFYWTWAFTRAGEGEGAGGKDMVNYEITFI